MKTHLTTLIFSLVFYSVGFLTGMASARADEFGEPQISNYQGSESGTSLIVLKWPDGVTDKLLYKNRDSDSDGYLKWLIFRQEAYERRQKELQEKYVKKTTK